MAIIYYEENQVFHLQTAHTTYQMKVGRLGYLMHSYYGESIQDSDAGYRITHYDRGFASNPNGAGTDRIFSLDTIPQEYSSEDAGDYRIFSLEVENGDGSFAFNGTYESHRIFSGKYQLEGLPGLRTGEDDTVDSLEITLKDEVTGVKAVLLYSVFEEKDVITRSVRIVNGGQSAIFLNRVMSAEMDFVESDFDLIHFAGRHTMERELDRSSLSYGVKSVGSTRGTSSHQHNPFVILCDHEAGEQHGECYGFMLVYSGNFLCEVQKDQYDQTRVVMGIHPHQFCWKLNPGETFSAPEVILAYSAEGLTHLSHLYHDIFRQNLCRSPYMEQPRPVLINSWEAFYFDFTHENLVKMAKSAKEMDVDLFVLDDGWFGHRDSDNSSLGDWVEDPRKLPRGLSGLAEDLKKEGLKFGLWLEPEMVSEESHLYQMHPDWCLKIPGRPVTRGRYQLVLDLSRQEVCEFIIDFIEKILEKADISYIKWDMNRSISDVWSGNTKKGHQGETAHRYILGLYYILETLTNRWPDVLFEGCSGGGGRFDAGMLYYHPQIWCSDNTDAINRLKIQYGTSFGYPISTVGSHLSVCPNHQTGRIVPVFTRGITAMSGTFGYELDATQMTVEEKEECNRLTKMYRKYQKLIFTGDYYRLSDPYKCMDFVSWSFVAKDGSEGLLNIVMTDKEPNDAQRFVRLRGLEKKGMYRIDGYEQVLSGQILMRAGLPIPVELKEYDALSIHFERCE